MRVEALVMNYLSRIVPVIFLAAAVSCGGGSSSSQNSNNLGTGAWSESLVGAGSQQIGSFTFNMTQSGTALTASSMNFGNMGSLTQCFGSGTVMNGQMGSGMMNGGAMNMTMSWTQPGGGATNTMTMQGTMANGMMSGTGAFTLTGQSSGCASQSGTFTMTHTSNSMM